MFNKMTIYIPSKSDPSTGKGFFCSRLFKSLQKLGYSVTNNPKAPHNVSLHLVKFKDGKGKKIIRLDGCYHNTAMSYGSRNKSISQYVHKADGIIYQSQFSKRLCDKYLGKFKGPTSIVPNGGDPAFYDNVEPMDLPYKNCFLTASRWRPHKRLEDIIESFLLADIPDSCLYIAGNLKKSKLSKANQDKYFALDNIVPLGKIDQTTLARYLKSSRGFVHLCWFDNCPNAVVEALCAGVPVISNNVGGTPEIVEVGGGFVCKIDAPYNLKPVLLYSPPSIDRNIIADAMKKCLAPVVISNAHVDIDNVAKQYVDFFERVANG